MNDTAGQPGDPPRAYDSRRIANHFIALADGAGQSMSIMRVLKLAYMAHGWCLALFNRELTYDTVEAWKFGPVFPAVYYTFRPQGIHNLRPMPMPDEDLGQDVEDLLQGTFKRYEGLSPRQLSRLTHIKGGPWDRIWRVEGKKYGIIGNELIAAHYKDKLSRSANG